MELKRKLTLLFVFLLLLSVTFGFSQNSKGHVRRDVLAADIAFDNNDFSKAYGLYNQAYALDTNYNRLSFKLGVCMYSIRKYKQQSLSFFEQAHRTGVVESGYYLGNLYHLNGNYEEAIHAFQEYKSSMGNHKFPDREIDFLIHKCKTAEELIHSPVNVSVENIGSTINSEFPDYVPIISADESVLIFTSRRKGSTGNLLDPYGDYFEDIYISNKTGAEWSSPRNISKNINTPTHDASVGLSADGELLVYRTSKELLSGDLYASSFNGLEWTVPEKLPSPINTKDYTSPSATLSADGQTIYFSSNRPGGFGKKDIYRAVKLPNGKWSKALNLGSIINTEEDEDSPFIHPDGKTLYFSSRSHKNMGGYDIFKTTLSEEGHWSEPVNMGYPVNTPDDDIYFALSLNGQTGYYSSDRPGGFGGSDIYLIHFPENDLGLTVFKGIVVSADSADRPISAAISLFDSKTGNQEGIYNTNPLTGKFIFILKWDGEYQMRVEAKGYNSYSGKVEMTKDGARTKIVLKTIGK